MPNGLPPTSVYLLPKLKAELTKAAKADRRSLSALISMIAEEWLANRDTEPKRKNSRA
jgi:hypothetical protein